MEPVPQKTVTAAEMNQYKTDVHPVWCPGCGDFGVLTCIYRMMATKKLDPENVAVVSGIGCSSRLPAYVNAYGFHTVHGRVLPVATGIKTANPSLEVLCVGGDGDAYSIGGGHIAHAARRNVDMCYIVMDNEIYGLTKGQVSATSPVGLKKGTTPFGQMDEPLNPIAMAIAYGLSFVARGYSAKPKELADLIIQGVEHKGFALINVLSPCTTFNDNYKQITPQVRFVDPSHDPSDRIAALKIAYETDGISLGVIYKNPRPTFEDSMTETQKRAEGKSGIHELEKLINHYQ